MDESSKETTGDRSTQIALTMGLLLFASVILGSGALGDDRDTNAAGDDRDAREDSDDRLANDRVDTDLGEEMQRLEMACDDGEGDIEACEELRGMIESRMTMNGDGMRGMDEMRGHDDRDIRGPDQMQIPPEILHDMAGMWCHDHVFSTFWENTNAVELEDGSGFEMITYDDEDNEESTVISHDAMWQITAGLEPLVESCTHMMAALMGVPMHHDENGDDWREHEWCEEHPDAADCSWMHDDWEDDDESDEWDEDDESNTPDEDEDSGEDEPRD